MLNTKSRNYYVYRNSSGVTLQYIVVGFTTITMLTHPSFTPPDSTANSISAARAATIKKGMKSVVSKFPKIISQARTLCGVEKPVYSGSAVNPYSHHRHSHYRYHNNHQYPTSTHSVDTCCFLYVFVLLGRMRRMMRAY